MYNEDQIDEGEYAHSLDQARKGGKFFWAMLVLFFIGFLSQTLSLAP